jgi:pimeloyl-ACP methyl ester carboxylesterase
MDRRSFATTCLIAISQAARAWRAGADDMPPDEPSTGYPNAVTPTLGGKQFWADELFFHDWHIQRNVFTGHCRLLSGANLRYAWGSFDECRAKLQNIKHERKLGPMDGPGVVVLHGLMRSSAAMNQMCRHLGEQGGYSVFNVSYPSTRGTVADHARVLDKVVESLEGINEIHFVAHSLGNLVIRHYLADHTNPQSGIRPDPRIKRMVMLGPPNRGAQLAEALAGVGAFHVVAGASATQLAREWDALAARLATPAFEFGILAGGRGTTTGYNPWLGQDNDMIVSVESTRLAGAADFAVLPTLHTFMMDDPKVQEYTLRFLQHGYFVSQAERQPIAADPVTADVPADRASKIKSPAQPRGGEQR